MVRFSAILMEKTLDFFFSFAAKGYFQFCFQTQEINRFIFKPWWVHSHSYSFVLHRYSLELKKPQSLYNPTECCSYQVDLTFIQPFQQVSLCLIIFVQDIVANFFMEFDLHFQTNKTTKKTCWINYLKKKKTTCQIFRIFFFLLQVLLEIFKETFHRKYYFKARCTMRKAGQKYSFYRCYPWVSLGSQLQVPVSHSSHQVVSSSKFQHMAAPHIVGFIYISLVAHRGWIVKSHDKASAPIWISEHFTIGK